MRKLISIVLIFINSLILGMKEKDRLINKYKQELLKIVNPGIESIIAGSDIKFKVLGYYHFSNKIVISNDSKRLVIVNSSIDVGNKIYIWNLENFDQAAITLDNPDGKVTAVAISNCNNYLVTAISTTRAIKIWDISERKIVKAIKLDNYVNLVNTLDIALDKDLRYMVIKVEINRINYVFLLKWDLDISKEYLSEDAITRWKGSYNSFALSDSGHILVLGNTLGEITIVNMKKFPILKSRKLGKRHLKKIDSIAITSCDKLGITTSEDSVKVWNLVNLELEEEEIELKSILNAKLSRNSKKFPKWYYFNHLQEMSMNHKHGLVVNFYPAVEDDIMFFDIGDLEDVKSRVFSNYHICTGKLSKNGKYLIAVSNDLTKQRVCVAKLSDWAINDLDLDQIQLLVELIEKTDITEILNYFKLIKLRFNQNLQSYIERYLRNKFISICYSESRKEQEKGILNIINEYLGAEQTSEQNSPFLFKSPIQIQLPKLIHDSFRLRHLQKRAGKKNQNKCKVCRKLSIYRCGHCKLVYYCSKECQQKHWKEHKLQCEARHGN